MPLLDTLKALPPRSKGILAVSAVAIIAHRVPAAADRRRAVVHAAHLRASTPPRPARSRPRSTSRASPTSCATTAPPRGRQGPGRPGARGARRRGRSLDGASGQGFELFDEQKLGASDFQQKVTYQRALEGEIARTIGGVEGVTSPQVQLVLPEDDLFADEASPATAAVMLGNSADTIEPARRAASPSSSPRPSRASRPTTSRSPTPRARSCGRPATARAQAAWPPASRRSRRATRAPWRPTSTRCSCARSARARPRSRSAPT